MPNNPFDQACRYLCKQFGVAMLAWLLRMEPADFVFRRWLDTKSLSFPGQPDRTCDTVAHIENVADGQSPWAVIVEFQIAPDELMFGRCLGYSGPMWIEHKPSPERGDRYSVGVAVVNLTGRGNTARDMHWPKAGFRTTVQPVERNLAFESASALVADVEAGRAPRAALAFVPLMQGGAGADIIAKWKELATAEPDVVARSDYGGLAVIFAGATDGKEIWKEALKEWDMVHSAIVDEWRKEGITTGNIRLISRALVIRFGPLPAEVASQLQSLPPTADFDAIFDRAMLAATLNEFRAALPPK